MKLLSILVILTVSSIFLGCATIVKGYSESVDIWYASKELKVFTTDGIEIPVKWEKGFLATVTLRSKHNHVLILKQGNIEKKVVLYPKMSLGWFCLDLICGGIPIIPDAITGNWNYYDMIDAR